MACGEYGPGRMAEAADILAAIEAHFAPQAQDRSLAGRRVLVTAGPTQEAIDPVRYIANRSSGKQGYAIAAAAAALGADTVLVSGPVNLAPPAGVRLVRVETALQMLAAVEAALPVDIAASPRPWPTGGSRDRGSRRSRSRRAGRRRPWRWSRIPTSCSRWPG